MTQGRVGFMNQFLPTSSLHRGLWFGCRFLRKRQIHGRKPGGLGGGGINGDSGRVQYPGVMRCKERGRYISADAAEQTRELSHLRLDQRAIVGVSINA